MTTKPRPMERTQSDLHRNSARNGGSMGKPVKKTIAKIELEKIRSMLQVNAGMEQYRARQWSNVKKKYRQLAATQACIDPGIALLNLTQISGNRRAELRATALQIAREMEQIARACTGGEFDDNARQVADKLNRRTVDDETGEILENQN